jgi:putative transposase
VSAFIDANRARLGVEPLCRELEVSASAYRARRTRPPSARALRDAWLLAQIRRVHQSSNDVYGQFKIWDELNDTGVRVARCTVERLMRTHGTVGIGPVQTKKTTLPGLAPAAAPDLVRRDFTASRPDQLCLADFTYVRTWQGWSYLAVVLDVHTRRIVGGQLASHMRQSLVSDGFEMALAARLEHEDGLVAHSDNGSQYTSYEYTERLVRAGIAPSRGRTGTALDNAMAESAISTLKRELISRYRWPTRLDLELALVSYIGWYNSRRRHRSLKTRRDGRTTRQAPLQVLASYNDQVPE